MHVVNPIDTSLEIVEEGIKSCTQCELHKSRTHAVVGEGPIHPQLMLIGEAPGKNEDESGKPFCGASGKKLTDLLEGAGLRRKDVFITSVLKCRPPENRVPTEMEAKICTISWLTPQIQLLKPKVIGMMGKTAIQYVLGKDFEVDLKKDHGRVVKQNGHKYVVLYHPAAMIYNQSLKQTMEEDFKQLAKELNMG